MKKIWTILRLIAGPLAIIFIDVFLVGFPICSIFITLAIILYMIPKTLLSLIIRKQRDKFKGNLTGTFIYIGVVVLVFFAIWLQETIAANQSQQLVEIIEQYHLKHNRYPDRLEELVPEFTSNVPSPRSFFPKFSFYYSAYEDHETKKKTHSLMHFKAGPFQKRAYSFEDKKWTDFGD